MGSLDGVTSTRSGWRDGLEVVELTYDPKIIEYKTIVAAAAKFKCIDRVYAHDKDQFALAKKAVGSKASLVKEGEPMRDAKVSDQKYYLKANLMRLLPLTEIQATKVNGALYTKSHNPKSFLSSRQRALLKRIAKASKVDSKALSKLVRPKDLAALNAYTAKLEATLTKLGVK